MPKKYSLDIKIEAMDRIERHGGDVILVSRMMGIHDSTLWRWQAVEGDLRERHRERQRRQREQQLVDFQAGVLERAQAILRQMDDETLAKAPLNQLTSALGTLVSQISKLKEAIEEVDEREEVIRFEHFYDGAVQEAPPWAGASAGFDRSLQSSGVWEALGEDGAWQGDIAASGAGGEQADLVVGADAFDGEPSVARLQSQREVFA